MIVETMGTDFGHKKNEFSPRIIRQNVFSICSFDTDFVYEHEGALLNGNKGEILINEPNKYLYHGPRKNAKTGYINDWMHIAGSDLKELLEKYPLPLNKPFSVDSSFNAKKYFKKIEFELLNKNDGYNDVIKSLVTQLIIKLYRELAKTNFEYSNNVSFAQINNIHYEILKNPGKKWNLKIMSEQSGYSISRFCEIYKNLFKETPIKTVNNSRIEMAKKLLSSGQINVGGVAKKCGYSNIYYFSRFFKKATGYNPSYFIENEI